MSRVALFRRNQAFVVPIIVFLNAVVFVSWHWTSNPLGFMAHNFTVSWNWLLEGRYWVLLGAVFSHNMLWHLLINMFVLLNFGGPLERILGSSAFLIFYLSAGVLSSLAHASVSSFLLGQPDQLALGASGAVAGVILVFSLLFPKEKILLLGFIPIPALFGAVAFVAIDIWGLIAQTKGGGLPIGHGAHLGGALTGVIYYLFWIRGGYETNESF